MAPFPSSPPPIPPPIPVETHPNRTNGPSYGGLQQSERELPDPNRLAPEDAYYVPSSSLPLDLPRPKEIRKIRGEYNSRRRRRKGAWKKLLWVRQSCKHTSITYIMN